ncbi:MAG: hypothetical protein ABJD07_10960 [Gemmatimonadaceae bacterium]
MSYDENTPPTEPRGALGPPRRRPPTAIATATPPPPRRPRVAQVRRPWLMRAVRHMIDAAMGVADRAADAVGTAIGLRRSPTK